MGNIIKFPSKRIVRQQPTPKQIESESKRKKAKERKQNKNQRNEKKKSPKNQRNERKETRKPKKEWTKRKKETKGKHTLFKTSFVPLLPLSFFEGTSPQAR